MLLTKQDRRRLPPLGAQDGKGIDAVAYVKFFGTGRWTYFVTEFDGEDMLYGFCVSPLGPDCDELGYSSLGEIAALRFPPFGLPAERDRHFTPQTVREAIGQAAA